MSEVQNMWKPKKKYAINLLFFLISIILIVAIWPKEENDNWLKLLGRIVLVSSCYLVLYQFLSHFRSEVLMVTRKTLFIIIAILSFVVLTRIVIIFPDQHILLLIPFAIIPVIIRTFYDARLALFILLITVMLSGFIVPGPFEFVFISFISGMIAIFTLSNMYRRAKLFITSLMIVLSYSGIYLGISLMKDGNFGNLAWSDFILIMGNGILVLISYPLIFIFEKNFLFLSDATLLELADTNQPLLRKLAEEAPGSFQHSLQVANLAEEAARITGANLLLVRTGALYHDIGKIAHPKYYIENQEDEVSPHDNLDPLDSAKVILNHVKNGVVLAKNYKVPVQIIDFIRTHHGTTIAYYFYKKYSDQHPWDTSKEKEFTYPGPKPFSKETAVVMMADAVEASSRSLGKYSEESISELVEKIIYMKEQEGQFSDVPLTFKDISDIKNVFKKRLLNIYHVRIVYPERG
ncbi:MAG: HDIG domain-containing protein [Bacteroidetes bacterium]|nr:MAG: HDIG domain-containing protein [Bacteroidota bacterium]